MLDKLFEKVNSEFLTDEVKLELSTIFESQLNEAIAAKEQELEESNKAEIVEFKDEMITKLDEYLAYFVEEFTKEQETQIVEAVKVERATEVLSIFEGLVKQFNVQLDEEVIANTDELEEAKAKLSESVETIMDLRKELQAVKIAQMVEAKASEFEVDTEQDRFRKLAETVSFDTEEIFASKLTVIAESVKDSKTAKPVIALQEDLDDEDDVKIDEKIESTTKRYMKYL